jgi:hypothetical protein
MVTLPFVIDSITRIHNVDDDDIADRQFRENYIIPTDSHNNTPRGLRGSVYEEVRDIKNEIYDNEYGYENDNVYELKVDNIDNHIIYAIVKYYCLIDIVNNVNDH